MHIQDAWEKALKTTTVIRPRVQPLEIYSETKLPYIFLAESTVNSGDTVVRRGEIVVEKPSLVLPFNAPQFIGFDFEESMNINEDLLINFFLVRGVSFPSLKYNNQVNTLDVREGRLSSAIEHYKSRMQSEENVHTGLVTGKEDVWQLAVLIFICQQVAKNADHDFKRLFDDYQKRNFS